MPVVLEVVSEPSEQDKIDLNKIYQDFSVNAGLPLLDVKALPANFKLYAGRFNARLLGAFLVEEREQQLMIRYLCVRKITRGRHVAREMLRQFIGKVEKESYLVGIETSEALTQLMTELNFTAVGNDWRFVPKGSD